MASPTTIAVWLLAIISSLTLHEFAHAYVADRLGDPTPRRHGRLTLNPMVLWKAEPIGSLIVPIIGALQGFAIGWATTPVNPRKARKAGSIRRANRLIALAGPVSNILLAAVSLAVFAGLARVSVSGPVMDFALHLSSVMVLLNILLAVFNLLPIPPLDGFAVFKSLAPRQWLQAIVFLQKYGLILLVLTFMYGRHLFVPVFMLAQTLLGMVAP